MAEQQQPGTPGHPKKGLITIVSTIYWCAELFRWQ